MWADHTNITAQLDQTVRHARLQRYCCSAIRGVFLDEATKIDPCRAIAVRFYRLASALGASQWGKASMAVCAGTGPSEISRPV